MEHLINELKETKNELIQLIGDFKEEHFNTVPFAGSWTPGQIAEHILKSKEGLPELLRGPSSAAKRPSDQKVTETKSLFLNFEIKMKSAEFILPGTLPWKREVLQENLNYMDTAIIHAAQELDLNLLCLGFELPVFGKFTRLEWLYFNMYHTQRHIHQLKNVLKTLSVS
ncbi:DinB family protein [Pedobacter nutrimenti]|jgi:hypothetical protein|uniref:DinB family protein n=1 Tax=Pedobacter nutrimenti TaxID=1241337 RepID=A0A318UB32_9SPHI|nr:DinB family protein [Pedobacter nutrimenti]PYF72640.1 DinB family protein [Pedobacter nutrimenti]